MQRIPLIASFLASMALALGAPALAQPKDKGGPDKGGKDRQEQRSDKGGPGDKEKKPKKAKHTDGKKLVGDKVKKNGKHELHKNGKHTAFVDVQDGKIRGVNVKHADKGDTPVKKYRTKKPPTMASASAGGIMPVNMVLTQGQYIGTEWIGYAYIDDWGDEVIYWFPYDMVYDPWTGAVEYVPAY